MIKSKIEQTFVDVQIFCTDAYVADYTEKVQQHLKTLNTTKARKAYRKQPGLRDGVHIQTIPFDDISYFHLQNTPGISYYVVNFENNKSFFPSGKRDCECLFRYKGKKGWSLLCELKYNQKEKTIPNNVEEAYEQLKSTWELCVHKQLFGKKRCHCYWNISLPNYSLNVPFSSFLISQSEQIEWRKKNKIQLLGYNDVLIVNEGILQVPPAEV